MKYFKQLAPIALLVSVIALYIAIGYVAVHFIIKFW